MNGDVMMTMPVVVAVEAIWMMMTMEAMRVMVVVMMTMRGVNELVLVTVTMGLTGNSDGLFMDLTVVVGCSSDEAHQEDEESNDVEQHDLN